MNARTEKVRLCQQICIIIGHRRSDPGADNLTRAELLMVYSYLNLIKGKPDERNRKP
jgi:hypothetical protein